MPQRFKFLFADDTNIFGVKDTGELLQWSASASSLVPLGTTDVTALGALPTPIIVTDTAGTQIGGAGWADFTHLFAGGGGIIYAVKRTGELLAYLYDRNGGWSYQAAQVGTGWAGFVHLACDLTGIIFAVEPGGALRLYNHTGRTNNPATSDWTPGSGAIVASGGWNAPFVVSGGVDTSSGGRHLAAVFGDGTMKWYRKQSANSTDDWDNAGIGVLVGTGGVPMTGSDQ